MLCKLKVDAAYNSITPHRAVNIIMIMLAEVEKALLQRSDWQQRTSHSFIFISSINFLSEQYFFIFPSQTDLSTQSLYSCFLSSVFSPHNLTQTIGIASVELHSTSFWSFSHCSFVYSPSSGAEHW